LDSEKHHLAEGQVAERQDGWESAKQDVDRIVDKLGKRIDEKIKPLVLGLRVFGFETTGSCEGHREYARSYPWIEVESRAALRIGGDARFKELEARARASLGHGVEMSKRDQEEQQTMIEAIRDENEKESRRLERFLVECSGGRQLEALGVKIERGPWNQIRVTPHAPSPSATRQSSEEDEGRKLASYQHRMLQIGEMLRRRYFEGR
jgi:hypothetical protein